MGYSMTSDEIAFWQDQAALLDPAAYEFVVGSGESRTVTTAERWYLVNGWRLSATSGEWFHRTSHVDHALPLTAGTTITTAADGNAYMYLCKPSLVTGSDDRYTTDPRALYFDRMLQIAQLTQYRLAGTNTGTSTSTVSFPSDFTDGLIIHASVMDLAWVILLYTSGTTGLNLFPEISDSAPIRQAEGNIFPFKRTSFPSIMAQGASLSTGAGQVVYLKLPGGW